MQLVWQINGWEDYLSWQETDKEVQRTINRLINACHRNPFKGIGKPEPLKGLYAGCWSRRIKGEHRLIYAVRNQYLHVLQCRFHRDFGGQGQ